MLCLNEYEAELGIQAYLRFANIPHHIAVSNYPHHTTGGKLPILRDGEKLIGNDGILPYLKKTRVDLDAALSPLQASDGIALLETIRSIDN